MNLYQLHSEPKSLDHHDVAHESVPKLFWEKYKDAPSELKKREATIATDLRVAADYARYVLKGRFPAGEAAIAKKAGASYLYALTTLNDRFPAGEAAIAKDADCAYRYALNVLKGAFPAGEAAILSNTNYAKQYQTFLDGLKK